MLKSLLVFGTLVATVLIGSSIKNVPWSQLFGLSSIAITTGALFAVALKIGRREFVSLLLGRADKQSVKLAVIALAMSAGLGLMLGLMVVMINLQNPAAIGPGLAASSIAVIYSLLLTGYLSIINAPKIGQENRKCLSKYNSASITNFTVEKEQSNEKHAA